MVNQTAIDKIASAKTPQDILAILPIPSTHDTNLALYNRVVIADGIKDPGNMGTIIRSARAFGFESLMTTTTSVDIFNPKVVRATQGAMFGIKIIDNISTKLIEDELKTTHTLYALDPGGDINIDDIESEDRSALIIGSEIEGIEQSLLKLADYRIRISHTGSVDSLNAAVAGGIAMHRFGKK
jgi:TrmH family RNA methyltransferase